MIIVLLQALYFAFAGPYAFFSKLYLRQYLHVGRERGQYAFEVICYYRAMNWVLAEAVAAPWSAHSTFS